MEVINFGIEQHYLIVKDKTKQQQQQQLHVEQGSKSMWQQSLENTIPNCHSLLSVWLLEIGKSCLAFVLESNQHRRQKSMPKRRHSRNQLMSCQTSRVLRLQGEHAHRSQIGVLNLSLCMKKNQPRESTFIFQGITTKR